MDNKPQTGETEAVKDDRIKKWKQASDICAEKQWRAENPFDGEIKDIKAFISGDSWEMALLLLKNTGKEVQVGYIKGTTCYDCYFLNEEGFFSFAAMGSKKNKARNILIKKDFVLSEVEENIKLIAEAFRNQEKNKEVPFLSFICEKLDMIAE